MYVLERKNRTPSSKKKLTHMVYYKYQQRSIANMSINPKFVELTADVLAIFLYNNLSLVS